MPTRKYTKESASNIVRENPVSFTFIIVGLINIVIQLVAPDAVPDVIIRQIHNTADSGLVALYTLFLYLWVFGGIASVLIGLFAIIVKGLRS
jgi:membrane glycosyltransferase